MDYEIIYKDILELTDSEEEAAKAVALAFEFVEKQKADAADVEMQVPESSVMVDAFAALGSGKSVYQPKK